MVCGKFFISQLVGDAFGVIPNQLRQKGHGSGQARSVAIELAARLGGKSLREIGHHYGGLTPSAVNMKRRRFRERNGERDPKFRQLLRQIQERM